MFSTSWSVIFIFFFGAGFLLLMALMIRAFSVEIAEYIKSTYGAIKSWWHEMHRKYGAVASIIMKIRGNELSYSVDIVFQLFCHFYDIHKHEMDHWGFDKHSFPEGRRDLSDLYRWIKKTRIDNYGEQKNILNHDRDLEYWGVNYKCFKFRINKHGELVITPHDNDKDFNFERTMMRLQNALYKLDTEKCDWIIERRRFFGF